MQNKKNKIKVLLILIIFLIGCVKEEDKRYLQSLKDLEEFRKVTMPERWDYEESAKTYDDAIEENDVKKCEDTFYPYYINKCYLGLAVKNKNFNICENIKPRKVQDGGINDFQTERINCYAEVAISTNAQDMCEQIPNNYI